MFIEDLETFIFSAFHYFLFKWWLLFNLRLELTRCDSGVPCDISWPHGYNLLGWIPPPPSPPFPSIKLMSRHFTWRKRGCRVKSAVRFYTRRKIMRRGGGDRTCTLYTLICYMYACWRDINKNLREILKIIYSYRGVKTIIPDYNFLQLDWWQYTEYCKLFQIITSFN